jgi:hypothetical protein
MADSKSPAPRNHSDNLRPIKLRIWCCTNSPIRHRVEMGLADGIDPTVE